MKKVYPIFLGASMIALGAIAQANTQPNLVTVALEMMSADVSMINNPPAHLEVKLNVAPTPSNPARYSQTNATITQSGVVAIDASARAFDIFRYANNNGRVQNKSSLAQQRIFPLDTCDQIKLFALPQIDGEPSFGSDQVESFSLNGGKCEVQHQMMQLDLAQIIPDQLISFCNNYYNPDPNASVRYGSTQTAELVITLDAQYQNVVNSMGRSFETANPAFQKPTIKSNVVITCD